MKRTIKYLFMMTLVFASVFLFTLTVNAATPEFRADDEQQKIVFTTAMPTYNGSAGYAIQTLAYLLNINNGSTSMTVFLEGNVNYHQLRYSTIISEFNTEHGSAGKTLAENYFYGYSGTMTLNTVFTLFQKGDVYNKSIYGDYRINSGGVWGYVQAKINGSSNASTPTEEVYASNWTTRIKIFSVKFWNWSTKSYAWSLYSNRMNAAKTATYPLNPNTFTASTVRYYSSPDYAADWQSAAMMCEFSTGAVNAIREYYNRTIVRVNNVNFKVSEIQAPTSITDSGTVKVLYSNDHFNRGVQTVSTNLTLSGGDSIDYELALDTNNYSGCWLEYNISGYTSGAQTLTATVNGGTNGTHRFVETTYADNIKANGITVVNSKDFGVWGISVPSGKIYENNTVNVKINWTNYKSTAYSNIPAQIYIGGNLVYTDYISFAGYGTVTKSYGLNVGTGVGNKQIKAQINWTNHLSESDPNDNEATNNLAVFEYYEFSISNLSVTPTTAYQGSIINVSFRTDSLNPTRAYSNIPVEVLYDGVVIKTEYVNFAAYGFISHNYTINIGSSTGQHTVMARINWANKSSEVNPNNNQTTSQAITVMVATNLQIEHINTFGEYREGTEVISTFKVKNIGVSNILPINNLKIRLVVSYPGGSISIPQKTAVVIPANGDNLVYFRWTVPSGTVGKVFTLTATVNPDNTITENNSGDNTTTVIKTIIATNTSSPPNTRFEKSAPADFIKMNPPNLAGITSASWSEWVYEGGAFVKKTYGLSLIPGVFSITPDINSPSKNNLNGNWYMGSGYGFTATWNVSTSTLSGTTAPNALAYTEAQVANTFFPEFQYSKNVGGYRSFSRIGANSFCFPTNPYALNNARLHYTPLWFPDGNYIAQGFASDLWTPAGMMYGYTNSNPIIISQSALDDWYIGKAK